MDRIKDFDIKKGKKFREVLAHTSNAVYQYRLDIVCLDISGHLTERLRYGWRPIGEP